MRFKCPNGKTQKPPKSRKCVPKSAKKRCPKGSRKNKNGDCIKYPSRINLTPFVHKSSIYATPENIPSPLFKFPPVRTTQPFSISPHVTPKKSSRKWDKVPRDYFIMDG